MCVSKESVRTRPELDCATKVCHHKAQEGPPSRQPSPCCMLVWKGWKGDQEQDSALSDKGQRRKPRHASVPPKRPWLAQESEARVPRYCHHVQTLGHICTHTQTHTHTKKDPDIQRRKDMDVLKIAQNPQSPNLRNAKSPMSGDKTTAQEQAIGSPSKGPWAGNPASCAAEDRKVACSHRALGASGGGGVQEVDSRRWTQPGMLTSATPPPKETTLYGTNKVGVWAGQVWGQIQQEGGSRG